MEKKQVVLITGCSSGIGRALAEAWHHLGMVVYATARNTAALQSLAGQGIRVESMDVLQESDIRRVVEKIAAETGRLDILVNNAGYGAIGPVVEMPLVEVRRQFETNAVAPLALVQAALPLLRRTPQSVIVQIGSVSATLNSPFAGAYCASKAALHALSDALRMELAPFAIRVLIVAPGAIQSNFGGAAEESLKRTLIPDSLYRPILDAIQKRAMASQVNPTPVEELVEKIVKEAAKKNPRAILRAGHGAYSMLLLKRLIPERQLDRLLSKKFGLNRLMDIK